jgi:hypothetical protein
MSEELTRGWAVNQISRYPRFTFKSNCFLRLAR